MPDSAGINLQLGPNRNTTQPTTQPNQIGELVKMKPVRDALEDLFAMRHEMAVLHAHGQAASPDRILKLTSKIDALAKRLIQAA